jgi:hypothetical protein
MPKYCIVFRGHNQRSRNNMSALDNVRNWNKTIFDKLKENNIEYDIFFITYNSEILSYLKEVLNPKKIILCSDEIKNQADSCQSQKQSLLDSIKLYTKSDIHYSKLIILRFDIIYKIPITEWNHFNDEGIILTNKDVHWPSRKLYSDIVFIVDNKFIFTFAEAVENIRHLPHDVGKYLFENNKPLLVMYNTYHHMESHPLFVRGGNTIDENKLYDVNNYETIHDVSQWN